MTDYFIDSSGLVKRYVPETGTGWVRAITSPRAGNTILVAQITQVEIVSGISRRKREGTIAARAARAIRLLVDRHVNREYMVITLTAEIVQRAEDLLEKYQLRAYDSIQLSTALQSNMRLVGASLAPLTFVCADNRLLSVAAAEGLISSDPNAHP